MTGQLRLRRSARVLLAILLASLTCACANLKSFPENPEPSKAFNKRVNTYFDENSEAKYYASNSDAERLQIRNTIIDNRIRVIGDELTRYEAALKDSRTTVGLGSNLLALAINGVGATTGTAETKAALAAAAAGLISADGEVSKQVYGSQTVDAIVAQMDADFDNARAAIYLKLKQSDASYPLSRASTDLTSLFRSIGLSNALSEISQQAKTQQANAKASVNSVEAGVFSASTSSQRLRAWLNPNGVSLPDAARAAQLQAWIDQQSEIKAKWEPPRNLPFEMFVSVDKLDGVDFEPLRARALSDTTLNIPN